MKKLLYILTSYLLAVSVVNAQELNCNVQVNSDKIEGTNKQVFQTLQKSISEYVNSIRWTGMTFAQTEKIECNMTIILNKVTTDNEYTAEIQVQSRRPVYGSTYTTPILNFRDKYFNFTYQEYDPLEYQENVFTTNLTAMLAYYCYLIIGLDMDSYQRLGGTPYFQQCENIITAAQTSSLNNSEMEGWRAFGNNKNRYVVISNLMDEAFRQYREFFYEYHRLGLDEMTKNVDNSRARMAQGFPILKSAIKARPNSFLIPVFLDTKADELVSIFQKGTSEEKKTAYSTLMDIDPTRQNIYDKINQQ